MSSSSRSDRSTDQSPQSPSRQTLDDSDVVYRGYRGAGPQNKAIVEKVPSGDQLQIGPSRRLQTHSRGFEWGYGGSGPAQLALAILLDYYEDEALARECYQRFCTAVISDLECDDGAWTLTEETIEETVETIQQNLAKARNQENVHAGSEEAV